MELIIKQNYGDWNGKFKKKKKNVIYTSDNNRRDNYTRLYYLLWEFINR